MAYPFNKPIWNKISVLSLVFLLGGVGTIGFLGYSYVRSPIYTQVGKEKQQPIPFSHELHVNQLQMDCRFCHTSVETSSFAGIPTTDTCLKCHSVVKKDSPLLAPLHASKETNMPIEWVRVHDLPDHVYFDHSIHVNKGIGCVQCHGQVDQMEVVSRQSTLLMQWCLDCHRHPQVNAGKPKDAFKMSTDETDHSSITNQSQVAANPEDLAIYMDFLEKFSSKDAEFNPQQYQVPAVNSQMNCSACHR